jgi:hypothetical protein
MKNPFHKFHRPVGPEASIEGLPIASDAVVSDTAASEIGEQTEMLTRLRRRNRAARPASPYPVPPARNVGS